MAYSLGRPHPDHKPHIGRKYLGSSRLGGKLYGTLLWCSCGFHAKVSNFAPSVGGRSVAQDQYQEHLRTVGIDPRATAKKKK